MVPGQLLTHAAGAPGPRKKQILGAINEGVGMQTLTRFFRVLLQPPDKTKTVLRDRARVMPAVTVWGNRCCEMYRGCRGGGGDLGLSSLVETVQCFSSSQQPQKVLGCWGQSFLLTKLTHFTESDYFLASEFGKMGQDWGFHPACARGSPEQVAFFLLLWFT